MLSRMSAQELTEWMAYEQVTGTLGPEREDILAGIIAATVASALSRRRFTPQDFIPVWDKPARQTWQEQLAVVMTINQACGGGINGHSE